MHISSWSNSTVYIKIFSYGRSARSWTWSRTLIWRWKTYKASLCTDTHFHNLELPTGLEPAYYGFAIRTLTIRGTTTLFGGNAWNRTKSSGLWDPSQDHLHYHWRKGWDSNPRNLLVQRCSRPPHSTALPPFLIGADDRIRTGFICLEGKALSQENIRIWSWWQDSNLRSLEPKSSALPD